MQSTTKTRFEKRLVDTAREILEAMPPPPAETKLLSIREAIQELAPTITKLLRRGHGVRLGHEFRQSPSADRAAHHR